MGLFKFIYPKNSLKRKILDIKADIKKYVAPVSKEDITIVYYGAYTLSPRNLVFWICVKSDEMKRKLEGDIPLRNRLRNLLQKYDYPVEARDHVFIGFESQETVDRESEGDWHVHFK